MAENYFPEPDQQVDEQVDPQSYAGLPQLNPTPSFRPRGTAAAPNPLAALTMGNPDESNVFAGGIDYRQMTGSNAIRYADQAQRQNHEDTIYAQQQERQARETAAQQKADDQFKQRTRNTEIETQYRAEGRPMFTDAFGDIKPVHDDNTWQTEKATRATKQEASKTASLATAERGAIKDTLAPKKKYDALKNTATSAQSNLEQAAREHALKKLEGTDDFKATKKSLLGIDALWPDPADASLTPEQLAARQLHAKISDSGTPLEADTQEKIKGQFLADNPGADADFVKAKNAFDAEEGKHTRLKGLESRGLRARAIAAGNDPAEAEALIPKTTEEITAGLDDDHARLAALRARASKGIPGPELDAHNAEEQSTVQRIKDSEKALQQSIAAKKQAGQVQKAADTANLHQAATTALDSGTKPAAAKPLTMRDDGLIVDDSGITPLPVARRSSDGSIIATNPTALDRVIKKAGDAPVFYEKPETAPGLEQLINSTAGARGIAMVRDKAAKNYDNKLPELQKFQEVIRTEFAPKRDEIQQRLDRGEIDEKTANDALHRQQDEFLQSHEDANASNNVTLTAAKRDFAAGNISAQQLNKVYAAAGQGSGVEDFQRDKVEEDRQNKASTDIAKLMAGSTKWFHGGEGSDPRLSKDYKSAIVAADNPDAKAAAIAAQEKKFAPQIAAFDKKIDDSLKSYDFDPATKAAVVQRARLQAAEQIPRDFWETLKSGEFWLHKIPFAGGFIAAGALARPALTIGKLQAGQDVSQEELAVLNETLIEMHRPSTFMAGALDVTVGSAAFAAELVTTAGIATAAEKGTQALVQKGLELLVTKEGRALAVKALAKATAKTGETFGADYLEASAGDFTKRIAAVGARNAMEKNLAGRTVRGIAGEVVRTPIAMGDMIVDKAVSDYVSKGVRVDTGENGKLIAQIDAKAHPDSILSALPNAYLYALVESTSERFGGFIEHSGIGAALAKVAQPVRDRVMRTAVFQAFAKANPTKSVDAIGNFLRKAQVHSLPEEYAEEWAGNAGHTIFNGEQWEIPDAEVAGQLAISMLIPGAAASFSHYRRNNSIQKTRDSAAVAHQAVMADLADPVKAAARVTDALGPEYNVTPEDITAAQSLVGPVSQGDTLRQIESAQADLDQQAVQADQQGNFGKAQKLRSIAAEHERAKTDAAQDDLADAVVAAQNLKEATTQAQQQVQSATDDASYAAAQQNLAAVQRAGALVKIARGRSELLTTQEHAALATAPAPAVVNDGEGDIITDSAIAEAQAVAPAAARYVKQNETQRRAQLFTQAQARAATPATSPAEVPQPGTSPGGSAPNAGSASAVSDAGNAQGAGNSASPAGAAPASSTTAPSVASQAAGKAPSQPSAQQSTAKGSSPTTGNWSAKSKSGTVVSIPAAAAKSSQDALEQLGAQLPMGDAIDPTTLIPPKQSAPTAKAAPATSKPAASPAVSSTTPQASSGHAAALEQAIQTNVPRSQHQKAKTTASHVAPLLDSFAPLFKGVRYSKLASGSGFQVKKDGTLHVDINRLTASMPANSSGEWIHSAFHEELIHLAAIKSINEAEARAFWQKLGGTEQGRALQESILRSYYAADLRADADPQSDNPWKQGKEHTAETADAWAMTHEFVRMMVQDKAFAKRVTEAMEVDPGLAEKLREFLRNIADFIRKAVGKLPDNLKAEAEAMEKAVIAKLQELGVPLDLKEESPPAKTKAKEKPAAENKKTEIKQDITVPETNDSKIVTGKEGTMRVGTATVRFRYAVTDARNLVTSHDINGKATPEFDANLQNRLDRGDVRGSRSFKEISAAPQYDRLSQDKTSRDGSPATDEKNQVLAGNARTLALLDAYLHNRAGQYLDGLRADASTHGITEADMAGIEYPVLTRQVIGLDDAGKRALVEESNAPDDVEAMTAQDQALQDAKNLPLPALAALDVDAEGNLYGDANQPFFNAFRSNAVRPAEQKAFSGGAVAGEELSKAGLQRVRNALFVLAYGSDSHALDTLESLTTGLDQDDPAKNISRALIAAAPAFARLNAQIKLGSRHPLSIGSDLITAARKYAALKDKGESVPDYLETANGLGGELADALTPLQQDILSFLEDNKRAPLRIANALHNFTSLADREGDPRQGSLLGVATPSTAQLWQKAKTTEDTLQSGERAGVVTDPRLVKVFGANYPADEYGMPQIPHTLPDGHSLLQPTAQKTHAEMPADHILVKEGLLPSGKVQRARLHEAMITHFLLKGSPLEKDQQPTVFILAGGPGAGKTTIRNKIIPQDTIKNAVIVGADEFRALLPEMQQFIDAKDGRGSEFTDAEAGGMVPMILKSLLNPNRTRHYNIIVDSLMASTDSLTRIDGYRAAGFATHLIGVTIDPYEAMVRAAGRALDSGRWVRSFIIANGHQGANANLPALLEQADCGELFDNTPPEQQEIASKSDKNSALALANPALFDTIKQRGKKDENRNASAKVQDTRKADQTLSAHQRGDKRRQGGDDQQGAGSLRDAASASQRDTEPPQGGLASARRPRSDHSGDFFGNLFDLDAAPAKADTTTDERPAKTSRKNDRQGVEKPQSGANQGEAGDLFSRPPESQSGQRTESGSSDTGRPNDEGSSGDLEVTGQGDTNTTGGKPESGQGRLGDSANQRPAIDRPAAGTPERDFSIAPDVTDIAPRSNDQRLRANIAALSLLKKLDSEDRNATPEEKAVLAQFSGWGWNKEIFNPNNDRYTKERDQLREALSEDEFRSAAASSLFSHYTSPAVIRSMWSAVERLGFKGGKVIESSAGIGHFFGAMPENLADRTRRTAVELDTTSGRILRKLYPETDVRIEGFEKSAIPNNSADLIISNFPFDPTAPYDAAYDQPGIPKLNLHNWFFAKSLDRVKPGGIVAGITTSFTMEAHRDMRAFLAGKGDLIAAIRLPNNAFKGNANTDVTTDILFFRKPDGRKVEAQPWLEREQVGEQTVKMDGENTVMPIVINEYFARHPEMALGEHTLEGSQYAANSYALVAPKGQDTEAELARAVATLPENIMGDGAPVIDLTPDAKTAERGAKEDSYVLTEDGEIMQVQNGLLQPADLRTERESREFEDDKAKTPRTPTVLSETQLAKRKAIARDFIKVRTSLKRQIELESDASATEEAIERNRRHLNSAYENFLTKHGTINREQEHYSPINFLEDDPEHALLLSIEDEKTVPHPAKPGRTKKTYIRGAILKRRVIVPAEMPASANNMSDAVLLSMGHIGRVDVPTIARLLGTTEEDATAQLLQSDQVFMAPSSGQFETAEQYLTGAVRAKLAAAIEAAKNDPRMARNVKALTDAQPPRAVISQITVTLGARWVPMSAYSQFVSELTGGKATVEYTRAANGYTVRCANNPTWSTSKVDTSELLTHALEGTAPKLNQTIGSGKDKQTVPDPEATALARTKIQEIKDKWRTWVLSTDSVHAAVEDAYNREVNAFVAPAYDGSYLVLPGLSTNVYRLPHRLRAIARILQEGGGMLAHGVGSGKTFTLISLAMEMKRLGRAAKPLIVVQKATIGQFAASFRQAYPAARILVATEKSFAAKNRKRLFARIATGEYDSIVVTQPQFDKIQCAPSTRENYMREIIMDLEDQMEEAKGDQAKTRIIQRRLRAMQAKLDKMMAHVTARQDDMLYFEQLGVDALLMDEAHAYKRAPITTNMTGIRGIPNDSSLRAMNLEMAVRHVHGRNDGKNVVLATGTPVTNTMAEAYIMLRLSSPKVLERFNIHNFDDFGTMFGDVSENVEYGWGNSYKVVSRFNKFVNGRELTTLIRSGFDVAMGNDELGLKVPRVRTGKPETVISDASPAQEEFTSWVDRIAAQFESLQGKAKAESSFIPIVTMQAGMAAALDARLVFPDAADHPDSKLNVAVRNILDIYKEGTERKTTQVVFADRFKPMSVAKLESFTPSLKTVNSAPEEAEIPTTDENGDPLSEEKMAELRAQAEEDAYKSGGFNLYKELKAKLIAQGIPEAQIAIIHDYNTDRRREELFAAVNAGEVRVLIGSTEKLGVGVNMQERLAAAHHLDPPRMMTPAMVEQRDGRIVRQGNLHRKWADEARTNAVERALATGATQEQADAAGDKAAEAFTVRVIRYATKNSMDAGIFQMLESKQKFITQALQGYISDREFSDPADEMTLSFAEMRAMSSGDDRVLRQVKLRDVVNRLQLEQDGFLRNASDLRRQLEQSRRDLDYHGKSLRTYQAASDTYEATFRADKHELKPRDAQPIEGKEAVKEWLTKTQEDMSRLTATGGKERNLRFNYNGFEANINTRVALGGSTATPEIVTSLEIVHIEDPAKVLADARIHQDYSISAAFGQLGRSIDSKRDSAQRQMEQLRTQIPGLQQAVGNTWGKEQELDAARNELAEINTSLLGSARASAVKNKVSNDTALQSAARPMSTDNAIQEAAQAILDGKKTPAARLAQAADIMRSSDIDGRKAIVQAARDFTSYRGISFKTLVDDQVKARLAPASIVDEHAHQAATSPKISRHADSASSDAVQSGFSRFMDDARREEPEEALQSGEKAAQDIEPSPGGLSEAEKAKGIFIKKFDPDTAFFKEKDQERGRVENIKRAYSGEEGEIDWSEQPKPIISYDEDGSLRVEDGHHRITVYRELGFKSPTAIFVPIDVWKTIENKYGLHSAGMSVAEHMQDFITSGQQSYQGSASHDVVEILQEHLANENLRAGSDSGALQSGERPGLDEDTRAGLDLLSEQIPADDLRAEARNSGSWFEDAIEYESDDAKGVEKRGLLDLAYHQRRTSQTHDGWNAAATAAVERDRAGVLKELVSDVLTTGLITNPVKIKAAQMLIPQMFRQAITTGDRQAMKDAQALAWGYDIAGTETARALASRWQPHKTREEANREMLAKIIFTPPPSTRKEIEALPTPAEKNRRIAELEKELAQAKTDLAQAQTDAKGTSNEKADAESRARAYQTEITTLTKQLAAAKSEKDRFERLAEINGERMARIEEELGNLGITLHDIFVSKEVIVRLRGSALVKRALEPFTEQERRAIKLMFDGKSDRQIANDLGLKRDAVNKLQDRAETAMLNVFTDWTKRGFSLADMESLDSAGNRVDLSTVLNDDGTLKAASRAAAADPLALDRAKEMLRAIMPTAKARNTGALRRFTGDTKASPYGFDPAKPYHAVAVARLIQSVDNNAMDMIYEYWINGLLSGPATHVANITGNAAMLGLEYTFQRGLEATANLFINDAALASFGEFGAMRKAAGWAFTDAIRAMRQAWKTEADLFESEWLNQPVHFGHAPDKAGGARYSIPGKLGHFIRIPCRGLLAMDAFFKHFIGRIEASAQAYRIASSEGRTGTDRESRIRGLVNTPGSAAWIMAVRQAKELTFQQELPGFLKSLERMKNDRAKSAGGAVIKTVLKFIFPFIRTPYNIFATGLRKTPLGTLSMVARTGTGLYQMKDGRPFLDSYPKALLVKHMVEQAMAWTAFALLYGLAEGDPDDDKKWLLLTGTRARSDRAGEKKLMERTRGGETEVVINGQPVFNYGRIEPFATIIASMVDSLRMIKKGARGARTMDVAAAVLGNLKDQVESKTFFQGIEAIHSAGEQMRSPDKVGKHLAKAFIKGIVPNIIKQPLRNMDGYARDTKNAPLIYSAFPMGGLAEPLYDLYGRPVEKTGNPVSRLFFQSGTKPGPVTPADAALNRYNTSHVQKGEPYYPGPDLINRYKDASGKWKDMTPQEMALQRREGGKNLAAKINAEVSPIEAKYPTSDTVKKIETARRSAFKETRDRMFQGGTKPYIPKRPVSLEEMMGLK